MRDLIHSYTARGWRLFPLHRHAKEPIVSGWGDAATNDVAVLRDWWRRYPGMNFGIACGPSGIFVIDVDKKHGGLEALAETQRSTKRFPPTLTQKTPSGGLHLIYRAPLGVKLGNKKLDRLGFKGIETRGAGGFIVVAPSFTTAKFREDGTQERWEGPYEWENSLAVAELPEWYIEMMMPAAPSVSQRAILASKRSSRTQCFEPGSVHPAARLRGAARRLAAMPPESGRNIYLNNAVYGIVADASGQIDANHVAAVMREAALASGLEADKVDATIRSAIGAALAKDGLR